MLKHENRLAYLSLDTQVEVDGLCFNLLEKNWFDQISVCRGVLIF